MLDAEHGGECDLRPEAERWSTLYTLLDAGATDDQLYAGIECAAIVSQQEAAMRKRRMQ